MLTQKHRKSAQDIKAEVQESRTRAVWTKPQSQQYSVDILAGQHSAVYSRHCRERDKEQKNEREAGMEEPNRGRQWDRTHTLTHTHTHTHAHTHTRTHAHTRTRAHAHTHTRTHTHTHTHSYIEW